MKHEILTFGLAFLGGVLGSGIVVNISVTQQFGRVEKVVTAQVEERVQQVENEVADYKEGERIVVFENSDPDTGVPRIVARIEDFDHIRNAMRRH